MLVHQVGHTLTERGNISLVVGSAHRVDIPVKHASCVSQYSYAVSIESTML